MLRLSLLPCSCHVCSPLSFPVPLRYIHLVSLFSHSSMRGGDPLLNGEVLLCGWPKSMRLLLPPPWISSCSSCARITSELMAEVSHSSGEGWKKSAKGSLALYASISTISTTGSSPTCAALCRACRIAASSEVVRWTNRLSALDRPSWRMLSIAREVVP